MNHKNVIEFPKYRNLWKKHSQNPEETYNIIKEALYEILGENPKSICANYVYLLANTLPEGNNSKYNGFPTSTLYGIFINPLYTQCLNCNGTSDQCANYTPFNVVKDNYLKRLVQIKLNKIEYYH